MITPKKIRFLTHTLGVVGIHFETKLDDSPDFNRTLVEHIAGARPEFINRIKDYTHFVELSWGSASDEDDILEEEFNQERVQYSTGFDFGTCGFGHTYSEAIVSCLKVFLADKDDKLAIMKTYNFSSLEVEEAINLFS